MPAGLVPSEASLLGVWSAVSPCVLPVSLCVYLCPNLFVQGHQSQWIQAHPNHLIHLTHHSKDPTSNCRHILSAAVRASTYGSWGDMFQPVAGAHRYL